MRVYIASNDSSVTTALQTCLQRIGVDCPASRIVAHESISLLAPDNTPHSSSVVFFVSRTLTVDELGLLKQLCSREDHSRKVVVVGAGLSPPIIMQAIRTGASDCLDIDRNLDVELRDVMQRFTASENGRPAGRMFTVIGSGGGSGATLVAVNLAVAMARRGLAAGLLDLHTRGGDAATFLNCAPRHTLASLAAKNDQLDLAMFEQSLVRHDSGIQLLASPELFSDFRPIRTELISRIIQLARHAFTHIVVDLDDCEHEEQVRVMGASERIIQVVRPDFVSVHRARKLLEILARAKVPRQQVMLVANRLGGPKALDAHHIQETLGMRVEHQLFEEPEAVNASVNLGVPVVLARPKAKLSLSITRLAETLTGAETPTAGASWARLQLQRLASAWRSQQEPPAVAASHTTP